MKQLLMTNDRALVTRVPRVAIEDGCVLVQTHYSLISTGTELAALKAAQAGKEAGAIEKAGEISSRAVHYLGRAINDPARAAQRLRQIAASRIRRVTQKPSRPREVNSTALADLTWNVAGATSFEPAGAGLSLRSDATPAGYQIVSRRIDLSELNADVAGDQADADSSARANLALVVSLRGTVRYAPYTLGLLNEDQSAWVGQCELAAGEFDEELQFACISPGSVYLVLANGGEGGAEADFDEFTVRLQEAGDDGLPVSETGDIGWATGYSAAGEVVAVGNGVRGFQVGDRVACAGAGQANHAEFISVRQNLCARVPAGVPLEIAATTTLGAIAMQGVRRTDPKLSEIVCVVGLGLIGMIVVQMFRAAGCRVIGLDLDPERVERAAALNIELATTSLEDCQRRCLQLSGGHGADATVITAAAPEHHGIINDAMRTTRRRGRVVIVGDVGLHVERADFYRKEIDLLMSTSYGPGRYDPAYEVHGQDYPYAYVRFTENRNMLAYLDLIDAAAIDVKSLIDFVVPLDEAPAAYAKLAGSGRLPIGVVIEYTPQPLDDVDLAPAKDARDSSSIRIRGARKLRGQKVGYCLVGAGGFGISMLVPQMDKRNDVFQLRSVCSRDPIRGGNFARQRSIETLTTDFDAVLADESIELVVIATRHHEHADQVTRALAAGKHVFVEKPLALTWAQLDSVKAAWQNTSDQLLAIGFNRSFAPAIAAVRESLAGRRAPLIVNYRLNGGYIPADSWIQDSQGGGRNIGEACHMYDLFRSLAGAPVADISARSIDPAGTAYFANDNFVANLRYEDGSLCNLVYTSCGPKSGMKKEHIEIFCDGQSWVVEDFTRCIHYPEQTVIWESDGPDKGHEKEFEVLADALQNGSQDDLVDPQRIFETTAVSLHIEDLLTGRL